LLGHLFHHGRNIGHAARREVNYIVVRQQNHRASGSSAWRSP
jgi:hypothetical protein